MINYQKINEHLNLSKFFLEEDLDKFGNLLNFDALTKDTQSTYLTFLLENFYIFDLKTQDIEFAIDNTNLSNFGTNHKTPFEIYIETVDLNISKEHFLKLFNNFKNNIDELYFSKIYNSIKKIMEKPTSLTKDEFNEKIKNHYLDEVLNFLLDNSKNYQTPLKYSFIFLLNIFPYFDNKIQHKIVDNFINNDSNLVVLEYLCKYLLNLSKGNKEDRKLKGFKAEHFKIIFEKDVQNILITEFWIEKKKEVEKKLTLNEKNKINNKLYCSDFKEKQITRKNKI